LLLMVGCDSSTSDFSPGSLGSVGEIELNCSDIDVQQRVDDLLHISPYAIKSNDTTTVAWWKEAGYDFLTYRCINIRKRLFMITINSDNLTESTVSIRAYYDRNKKTWIVASEFTSTDNYRAEKALEYLSNEMSTCL